MKQAPRSEIVASARRLEPICRSCGVPLVINDEPTVAVEVDAAGVHVGQGDLGVEEAAAVVGPERFVGVSTHSLDQARTAVARGADYLGFGAMFPTRTKERPRLIGTSDLAALAREVAIPCFPIGGIGLETIADLVAAGGTRAAISSAIVRAPDPVDATRRLVAAFHPGVEAGSDDP